MKERKIRKRVRNALNLYRSFIFLKSINLILLFASIRFVSFVLMIYFENIEKRGNKMKRKYAKSFYPMMNSRRGRGTYINVQVKFFYAEIPASFDFIKKNEFFQ